MAAASERHRRALDAAQRRAHPSPGAALLRNLQSLATALLLLSRPALAYATDEVEEPTLPAPVALPSHPALDHATDEVEEPTLPAPVALPSHSALDHATDDLDGPALPVPVALLEGKVVEKGTRNPAAFVSITLEAGEIQLHTESSSEGTFELEVPAGRYRVTIDGPGLLPFVVHEDLREGQQLTVRYLVERRSYDPYETVVIGKAEREEVARTSLRDREIAQIPGTFGDPFRVIGALPGVGQMFSLMSYPIVRGASPSNTGVLIDGVRVPQLYHYLAGPSVIHPAFIDRVDFYPGSFPLEYGGYTGGIIDGITRRARPQERRLELGLDLTSAGFFVRQPLSQETTATVAGRYGYPGLLLSTFSEDAYASYWDYQGRVDGRIGPGRWTVFAFGSHDEVGSSDARERLSSEFHRLDLRYTQGDDALSGTYAISFGVDQLGGGADAGRLEVFSVEPRLLWRAAVGGGLSLRLGLDGSFRESTTALGQEQESRDLPEIESRVATAGVFADSPWWLTKDLLVTPGARLDLYDTRSSSRSSIDPRVLMRYRAAEWEEEATLWLKGGVGLYHQPPRFFIPIPGLDEFAFELGLPASVQSSLGLDLEFTTGWAIDLQGYFNRMDPILFEPNFGFGGSGGVDPLEPGEEPSADGPSAFFGERRGRSYGLEFMLRKRDGGRTFGWVAYTLSRSERSTPSGWEAYDFDRTHMLHLVAGIRLPRNWEVAGRLQVQSGRPYREDGALAGRVSPFSRLDLRIDKRAVYKEWMLDFYIDLINVMIAPEPLDQGSSSELRYLLPTLGFRAIL